jgi:quinohemoprotein ethanol dehydrogenase
VDYDSAWNGGTLSTAGNLVFQGLASGYAVAYAADTGKELWRYDVNSGAMAGPVTYNVNGEQYVTFMVGWGGVFPLMMGPVSSMETKVKPEARVVTFKLGATGKLPPRANVPKELPELPADTADANTLAIGRDLFNGYCGGCHGMNAVSGGVIPDLPLLDARQAPDVQGYPLRGPPADGHAELRSGAEHRADGPASRLRDPPRPRAQGHARQPGFRRRVT